jgi:DNA mismatch repair protein MSH5
MERTDSGELLLKLAVEGASLRTMFHFISFSLSSRLTFCSRPRTMPWSRGRGGRPRQSRVRGRARSYGSRRSTCYDPHHRTASVTPSNASTSCQLPHRPRPIIRVGVEESATPDDDDDFLEQIIVAIDVKEKGKVGCAYYVAGEERLLCMEEILGGGVEVVEKCTTTKMSSIQTDSGSET